MKHKYLSGLRVVLALLVLCICIVAGVQAAESYTFVTKWGTQGGGDGQFQGPTGVAVDNAGNVYVTHGRATDHIQKFTSTGTFITKWGSEGDGDGQFGPHPAGIAVDSAGNVYVADTFNNRIQKFTSTGTFITKWGSYGKADTSGKFNTPQGVAVDGAGNVYVVDWANNRIQKFSGTGTFITKWGTLGSVLTGEEVSGNFSLPHGDAVDNAGNVYVVDSNNNRIQKFSGTGTFITKWGTRGSGDGQFQDPWGVAVDNAGNVYVTDSGNNRIQKFSSTGTFITKWGTRGSGDGQFVNPWGIAVDAAGNVYVADSGNNRIQKFSSTGTPVTPVTTAPTSTPATTATKTTPATLVTAGTPVTTVTTGGTVTTPASPCSGSGTSIYVEDRVMNQGQEFVISVMMCNAKDIANMDLSVGYDTSVLQFTSASKGSLNSNMLFESNNVGNTIKISFAGTSGFSGSGSIAILKFKVIGQNGSSSPITVTVGSAGTSSGNTVTIPVTPGKVLIGNTNPDNPGGRPDGPTALDALIALKISVDKLPFDINYDVSKDGTVNSNDARLLLGLAAKYR
jgi:sugar lactone lactonase YvrE